MTPEVTNLTTLSERYGAFLLDQFGVLLHGNGTYPFAPETVKNLKAKGKHILMLSNSGKRASSNEDRLTKLGFDRKDYLAVLSSGEAAYKILDQRMGNQIEPGTKVFVFSRDNDTSCIAGLSLEQTQEIEGAGLVILAGSQGDVFSLDYYAQLLKTAANRNVPCLCTNPDMTMLSAKGLCFGSGQIANLYEQLGGTVEWIGKPHPFIYEIAREMLAGVGAKNIICVGDSPVHDIAGGQGAGFKTALVRTGIHEDDPLEHVIENCAELDTVPDYILPKFEF